MSGMNEEKKRTLREMINQLLTGASPEEVKERFKKILDETSAEDVAKIEQQLVKEGMPREELQRLCDVHLAVFGERVEREQLYLPNGHPISILLAEHKALLDLSGRLGNVASALTELCDWNEAKDELKQVDSLIRDFLDAERHYLREENVLFPLMEKHGITEPPAIMWMEHDRIREIKRKLRDLAARRKNMSFKDFSLQLEDVSKPLCETLPRHFFKENNILFPAALEAISDYEWKEARKEFDNIGYCCFTPPQSTVSMETVAIVAQEGEAASRRGLALPFEMGSLSHSEIEAILNTLPVDVSFIDIDDSVKYFNQPEKRIFVRTKSVIGRKVQQCHPHKSVHVVNKIVKSFKAGQKTTADFWITMNDRLIYIRYFAVRDKKGEYIGTMEVVQDVTNIKSLEGQKRLLDWE